MDVGLVQTIDIDNEMQQSYLDYAMSVIVSRALPDARDGLKPVHRRILYAMYDMGLRPDTAFRKSARIVGEVLGKYHPHGDAAVYDAMARMAQDFSMRYQLVEGQGNFGSMDGDPPAAMRYTEARLQAMAMEMLTDLQKDTVDFDENFDGTLTEPDVLPSALPNMLVNGATGIAVGMSTSIPPHNLGEVVDALQYMLKNWEKMDDIGLEDLMAFVQGPDFPTGGVIIQEADGDALMTSYGSGRGRVTVQARAHVEEMERGRKRIIVTELPYQTNKASLIERIANLVREERLDGIADLRDESDRSGMRIVIELSRGVDPDAVLQTLYKSTPMRSTFSIIMLALVDGEPRLLSLKQSLRVYLDHRLEIVRRRSEHDLKKALHRQHVLEGLRIALANLDAIIDRIRRSRTVETAHTALMREFKLTDIQAQAILDMQLRRLATLERKKIEDEYKEVTQKIKELRALLRSPKKMRGVVGDELAVVREKFGDPRRTHIVRLQEGMAKRQALTASDLIPKEVVWVMVSEDGQISHTGEDKFPRLSGREAPILLAQATTRDVLYLVAENGEAAAIPMHTLPKADKPSDGAHFRKLTSFTEKHTLSDIFALPAYQKKPEDHFVVSITSGGMVKKSPLSELPGASSGLFTLARVNKGDRLRWVRFSQGSGELLLLTARGMAIRFTEEEVRPMGLVAAGVMGIKLQKGDEVIAAETLPQRGDLFMVADDGTAKRVDLKTFPAQGRYGQGVTAWKLPKDVRAVGATIGRGNTKVTMHLKELAQKQTRLDAAPRLGRTARGNGIQELKPGDRVIRLTVPKEMVRPEPPAAPKKPKRAGALTKKKTSSSKSSTAKSKKAASSTKKPNARKASSKKSTGSKNEPSTKKDTAKKSAATTKKASTTKKSTSGSTRASSAEKRSAKKEESAPKKRTSKSSTSKKGTKKKTSKS